MKKHLFLFVLFVVSVTPLSAQQLRITVSGLLFSKLQPIEFANVVIKNSKTQTFVTGAISNEKGKFVLESLAPGDYVLSVSLVGYKKLDKAVFLGSLSNFIDLGKMELEEDAQVLQDVQVVAKRDEIDSKLDKKTFTSEELKSQVGGSVLQVMQTIPGLTVQDGKLFIRGSSQVAVLVNGQQTALTGFSSQSGLDNIPASAIEKIEVINNPSAKYDANAVSYTHLTLPTICSV